MTTVINNPGNGEGSDSGVGIMIGVIIFVVVVGLFFVYALPAIRSGSAIPQDSSIDVNVKLPGGNASSTPAP